MITLIVGTNRPGSNSRKVAAQVEEIYAELLDRSTTPANGFIDFVENLKAIKLRGAR